MSLTELCQDIGLPVRTSGHHHTREGWIQLHCPFCGGGKSGFDLGYNVTFTTMNCWRCGKHTLWDFLKLVSPNKPPKQLMVDYGLTLRERVKVKAPATKTKPFPETQPLTTIARKYLLDRGFNAEHVSSLWGVQSTTILGRERHRLWIPVKQNGSTVSFTTRSIGKAEPKYLNALPVQEFVPLKHTLYGESMVTTPFVWVCEGPTDVWRIGPPAVATFGTQITNEQILRLAAYPAVALLLDNDLAGVKATMMLRRCLPLLGVTVFDGLRLGVKDPGELSPTDVEEIRDELFATMTQ
jgi:hypothetical protein